jgi:hypothetical protein
VEQVRDEGNAVSTTLVTVEPLRRAPELAVVGFFPLCHWVLRFLKNHYLTFCVVTHKAQNHRFHMAFIADDTMYVNWQIVALNYAADCILNFDETNIDLTPLQDQPLVRLVKGQFSSIFQVILGDVWSCWGALYLASSSLLLSSGKVSQMAILTERLMVPLIHMTKSSKLSSQRGGWMVQPTKSGYNASWLLMQLLITTKSTYFRICSPSIYTTTASVLLTVFGLK